MSDLTRGGLRDADQLYLDLVGRDTFYRLLASLRGQLFRDADCVKLYCPDSGRASVAPSLLAVALSLKVHDKVSYGEAMARADFDRRCPTNRKPKRRVKIMGSVRIQIMAAVASPFRVMHRHCGHHEEISLLGNGLTGDE